MQVEMAKKWSNKDTEAAIAAAFSQLGYPVLKAEQLEAMRKFIKGQKTSLYRFQLAIESHCATNGLLQ